MAHSIFANFKTNGNLRGASGRCQQLRYVSYVDQAFLPIMGRLDLYPVCSSYSTVSLVNVSLPKVAGG